MEAFLLLFFPAHPIGLFKTLKASKAHIQSTPGLTEEAYPLTPGFRQLISSVLTPVLF